MFIILNNGIFESRGMSGSDRRALQWSQIFRKAHNVTIMTSWQGLERYEKAGFSKEKILLTGNKTKGHSEVKSRISSYVFLFYLKQVLLGVQRLKNFNCETMYSSSDVIADALPALYKKISSPKTKWISGCHLIWPNPFQVLFDDRFKDFSFLKTIYFYFIQRCLFICFKKWASLVLVSNHRDKNFLIKEGLSFDKVLVTPGALNMDDIEKSPAEDIKYDACFMGRNHPQKGIKDVFLIWEKVVQKRPQAELAFMSDYPLKEFKEVTQKMNIQKNISYLGFIDGEEKYKILKQSKMFLFPSHHESFGMAALEAMACKAPVIAYDLAELKEFYGPEMIRVPMGDIEQFSKNVLWLMEQKDKRLELSSLAYKKAKLFSWESTADQILAQL